MAFQDRGRRVRLFVLIATLMVGCGGSPSVTPAVPGLPPPPQAVLDSQKAIALPLGFTRDDTGRIWCDRDGAEMVLVPGGEFVMGSDTPLTGPGSHSPAHRVHLSPFLIDRTVATYGQYRKFRLSTGGGDPPYLTDDLLGPMNNVRWQDAADYAAWAGKRLPTEAEWEKAARGTDGRPYPWGSTMLPGAGRGLRRGVFATGTQHPRPGTDPQNVSPFGVFDMMLSYEQWCSDWFDAGYYASSPAKNPTGPPSGSRRSIRGYSVRTTFDRCSAPPDEEMSIAAIRTVLGLEVPPK